MKKSQFVYYGTNEPIKDYVPYNWIDNIEIKYVSFKKYKKHLKDLLKISKRKKFKESDTIDRR